MHSIEVCRKCSSSNRFCSRYFHSFITCHYNHVSSSWVVLAFIFLATFSSCLYFLKIDCSGLNKTLEGEVTLKSVVHSRDPLPPPILTLSDWLLSLLYHLDSVLTVCDIILAHLLRVCNILAHIPFVKENGLSLEVGLWLISVTCISFCAYSKQHKQLFHVTFLYRIQTGFLYRIQTGYCSGGSGCALTDDFTVFVAHFNTRNFIHPLCVFVLEPSVWIGLWS